MYDFTAEDLIDQGEIGHGNYGTVNKMYHERSGTLMAVKVRPSCIEIRSREMCTVLCGCGWSTVNTVHAAVVAETITLGIQYIQSFKRLCIYEPIIIIIIIEIVYVKYIKVAISVIAASGIAAATQCTCW